MLLQVTFLMYLFTGPSNTKPVVRKLLVSFLFDLRCSEFYDDDYDGEMI
jgi:hypothetical protein